MVKGRTKNLIPVTKRTKQEQIAISRKGGKASGKARKKKAELRRALDAILTMEIKDETLKQQLEDAGLPTDNQTLLALSMFNQAIKGNVRAAEFIADVLGATRKDKLDIQEQKERIKYLKHHNRKQMAINGDIERPLVIVDEWASEHDTVDIDLGRGND